MLFKISLRIVQNIQCFPFCPVHYSICSPNPHIREDPQTSSERPSLVSTTSWRLRTRRPRHAHKPHLSRITDQTVRAHGALAAALALVETLGDCWLIAGPGAECGFLVGLGRVGREWVVPVLCGGIAGESLFRRGGGVDKFLFFFTWRSDRVDRKGGLGLGICWVRLRTVILNSPASLSQKEAKKEDCRSVCGASPSVGVLGLLFAFLID